VGGGRERGGRKEGGGKRGGKEEEEREEKRRSGEKGKERVGSPYTEMLLVLSVSPKYYNIQENDIFVPISRPHTPPFPPQLSSDADSNVRYGAELLDRLMKDVVSENPHFDIDNFILLLRDRIYTHDGFARQFLISWVCL